MLSSVAFAFFARRGLFAPSSSEPRSKKSLFGVKPRSVANRKLALHSSNGDTETRTTHEKHRQQLASGPRAEPCTAHTVAFWYVRKVRESWDGRRSAPNSLTHQHVPRPAQTPHMKGEGSEFNALIWTSGFSPGRWTASNGTHCGFVPCFLFCFSLLFFPRWKRPTYPFVVGNARMRLRRLD